MCGKNYVENLDYIQVDYDRRKTFISTLENFFVKGDVFLGVGACSEDAVEISQVFFQSESKTVQNLQFRR